jgi:hypothetical protein
MNKRGTYRRSGIEGLKVLSPVAMTVRCCDQDAVIKMLWSTKAMAYPQSTRRTKTSSDAVKAHQGGQEAQRNNKLFGVSKKCNIKKCSTTYHLLLAEAAKPKSRKAKKESKGKGKESDHPHQTPTTFTFTSSCSSQQRYRNQESLDIPGNQESPDIPASAGSPGWGSKFPEVKGK